MKRTILFAAALALSALAGLTSCTPDDELDFYIDMKSSEEIPEIINQSQDINQKVSMNDVN